MAGNAFGVRLEWAIKRSMNVREFAKSLTAKGSSYSQVRRYIDGRSVPNLEWVEAAARALEVSPGWLAFGEHNELAAPSVLIINGVEYTPKET